MYDYFNMQPACVKKINTNTQQIYQVQEPPTLRLQTEDKPHGGHDRGRDGTEERAT